MCDCVKRVNEKLRKQFAELELFIIGPRVPLIAATITKNRVLKDGSIKAMKPKRTYVVPSFCPFCAEPIPETAP